MQVLSLWAFMTTMGMIWGNLFKACARPDILLKLAIPQAAALVAGSILVVHRGIVAVSWVQAAIAIAAQVTVIVIAQRMFGLTVRSVLRALRPAILASGGLGAVLLVLRHVVTAPWAALVSGGFIGGAVYIGLLLLFAPEVVKRFRTIASAAPTTP
jgi:hypothetical protein